MLEVFRTRLGAVDRRRVRLSVADADAPWPLGDGSAAVVFASRVVHLLDARHVAQEVRRVCAPGGHFLIGRVVRDPDGVQGRLRLQRRLLLARQGLTAPDREDATERVLTLLVAEGARRIEARTVARWTKEASVRELLDAWERVEGAGGRRIGRASGQQVSGELRAWAADELGDLSAVASWEEQYVVDGVRDD
jgi:SAM-dependent methyltransferase